MWNEEKQKQLLETQELLARLSQEKHEYVLANVNQLAKMLYNLDVEYSLSREDWEDVASILLLNRNTVIKLLEELK